MQRNEQRHKDNHTALAKLPLTDSGTVSRSALNLAQFYTSSFPVMDLDICANQKWARSDYLVTSGGGGVISM